MRTARRPSAAFGLPRLEFEPLRRAVQHQAIALRCDADVGLHAPSCRCAHVGLHRVIRPFHRADEHSVPRLKSVLVGVFSSTFCPSSVTTASGPSGPAALTHPAGADFSGSVSNVSVHGIGRTTRARASPVSEPTVALMSPACCAIACRRKCTVHNGALQSIERPHGLFFAQEPAAAVERFRGQFDALTRRDHQFCRGHLHKRRGAFADDRRLVDRPSTSASFFCFGPTA